MNLYLKRKITIILISIISSLNLALITLETKIASAESVIIEDTEIQAGGLKNRNLGKYLQSQKILQKYKKLLAFYIEKGDKAKQGDILYKISIIYIRQIELDKALSTLGQAIDIYNQTGNCQQEAKSLIWKGEIYKYQGEYFLALKSYEEALAFYKKVDNSNAAISILLTIVKLYKEQDNYFRALELGQQVLNIAKSTKIFNREVIEASRIITDIYLSRQKYYKAITYAQESLKLAYKFQNVEFQLQSLNILGKTYNALKDYDKAILYAHRSLAIAGKQQFLDKKSKFYQQAVSASFILASAYASIGEYKKATVYAKLYKNERKLITQETSDTNNELGIIRAVTVSIRETFLKPESPFPPELRQPPPIFIPIKEIFLKYPLPVTPRTPTPSPSISIRETFLDSDKVVPLESALTEGGSPVPQLPTPVQEIFTRIDNSSGKAYEIVTPEFQKSLERDYSKGFALAIIANAHNSLGNYEKAIDYSNKSLPLARASQDYDAEVLALISSGIAYSSLGKYDEAISKLKQSTVLIPAIKESEFESLALTLLANVYASIKKYGEALDFAKKGLAVSKKYTWYSSQDSVFPSFVLSGIYLELGEYDKAIKLVQANLELLQPYRYTYNQEQRVKIKGLAFTILANAYFSKKEYREAIEYSQKSLEVFQNTKTPITRSTTLLTLGISYAELNNEKAAIKYLQQSLALIRKQKNPEVEGAVLSVLGSIYNKFGKRSQALIVLQQSLSVIENSETANKVFYPYLVLARTYSNLNKPSVAIAYYKEAIKRIEKVRGNISGLSTDLQKSFLQAIQDVDEVTTAEIYRELADLLLSQGRILEAQQVLELLKIKEISNFTKITNSRGEASPINLNRVEQNIIDKHGSLIAFGQQVYQCRQTNCKNQSQLNDQLEYLRAQYNQTVDTFVSVVRERKGQDDGFFDPRNLRDARKIVEAKPNTVLIYPFVLKDKIWLLWVSKGGVVKSIEIAQMGQQQLGQSVLKFRNLINNPFSDINEVKTAGKELYDLLIKPIEAELKQNNIKNLVFALDRATRYIPMSALYDGQSYLVENYNISTVLSAELTDTRESLPIGVKNTPVLGLGLSEASSGWSALPNVKDEIDSIVLKDSKDKRGIFPGLEFLNQSFTRKVLRDNVSKHKILHIATHGKFVPGSYLDSFLLLGDGKKLTIDDIRKLPDLGDAHLVVLSACETALADAMQDGVEIASIAYYFLNGGAETVMASLWLVSDESTRLLMENFYQNIALSTAKKPVTKAQALRNAQLSLLHGKSTAIAIKPRGGIVSKPVIGKSNNSNANNSKEYAHPYYWAAFILIGNGL